MKIIDYNVIAKNIENIKKTNELILVLKNNAYGFGMENILNIGIKNNIYKYAVNTIDEAINLRKLNNDISILLFGYNINNLNDIKRYNIIPTINSVDELSVYIRNNIKCSLEIDVGMNRFGIKTFDEEILSNPLIIELYAHLYKDCDSNYNIVKNLINLAKRYNKNIHFGGSIAYKYTTYPIRIAHMIYDDSDELIGKIVYVKPVRKNDTVGYDGLYKVKDKGIIGICNIGYYNGIKRNYSGRVSINGKYYQIVGKICMNHMFILIDSNVNINDLVVVYGKNIAKNEFLHNNSISNYESFLLIR